MDIHNSNLQNDAGVIPKNESTVKLDEININLQNETKVLKDFAIIYRGKAIKTNKCSLFSKCGYFKKNRHLFLLDEIPINEESYSIEIFEKFIESITSERIEITSNTVCDFFELSVKYEYFELYQQMKTHIKDNLVVDSILKEFVISSKKNINNENPRLNSNEIDDMKENILSENLNLSISSELLFEIKFEVLYRILTSPKRKIDNHHQLFRFILQIFDEFLEHNSNILNNENRNLNSLPDNRIYNSKREKLLITVSTKEQIQMLTSILDYEQMNQKEIEEMIKHPLFCDSYQPAHTRNFIQQMLSHQKELEKTIESSKTQIEDFKQIIAEQCSTYKVHFHELEENNRKLQDLNKSLQDQLSIQLSKQFLDHQGKMNKIENTLLEKIEQKIPVHIERIYNKKYQTRIKQLQNKDLDLENQIKQQISCTTDFNTKITNIDQEQKKQDKFIQQLQTQLSKSNKNQIIKINSALQSLNYGTYFEISYSNKNKDKGIIYVLRSIYSGNLHKLGILSISGNPEYSNDPSCLATKYSGCYYSKDELDSFISFDFRDHQVSLERYIFHNDCDFYCKKLSLKSWILEGSNDNISWGMLHKCNNCTMYGMYNVFTSQNTGKFRYIRLRMTGPNPSGNHVLHLHKIDFFGKYFPEYS